MDILGILIVVLVSLGTIDCRVGGNTTRFLTLIPGQIIHYGPVAIDITKTDSTNMLNSLISETQRHNKFTMDSSISVGGILKFFNIGASVSTGFEHWTTQSSTSTKSLEAQVANSMARRYRVKKGEAFLAAAEMEMFIFLDYTGEKRRLVLSTGTLHVGQFDSNSFINTTLDDTFTVLANKWGLQTFTHQQLQDQATNVSKVEMVKIPEPGVYYQIFNSQFPGLKLFKNTDGPGCTSYPDSDAQFWKFVQTRDGMGYYIFNKKYKNQRLAYKPESGLTVFDGRIWNDQRWTVEQVGSNEVRITSQRSGHKLGMNASNRCRAGNWNTTDDQIWILKPERNSQCYKKFVC